MKIKINAPSPEEIQKKLTKALDLHIDSVAQAKGYDNRITACIRAAAPKSKWYAEGVAFVEWMDNCYETAENVLSDVKGAKRGIPTWDEFKAELPVMNWPK
jgi:hypothetical protein